MHFYKFNIKDYAVNTTHLTNEEDLAYRRLLDLYYTDEQPIPNNNQLVSRRIRIAAEVVDVVLNEFFVLTENGWICGRVEEEIEGYRNLCRKRKEVGASGGRPPKKQAKPKSKQEETNRLAIAPIPLTTNQYISPIVPNGDMELETEEIPKPVSNPALDRFRNLFHLRDTTPLDASATRAWEKNKKSAAALGEEDWRVLEWAYRQKEGPAAQFRRKDLATLLNNILAEVTRARDWAARSGASLNAASPVSTEPSGWRDLVESEFPEVNLSTWAALPDSMKSWVREKQRELAAA